MGDKSLDQEHGGSEVPPVTPHAPGHDSAALGVAGRPILPDPEGQRPQAAAPRQGPLSGLTFVVIGTLSRWSRNEAEDLIKSLGGSASSSMTKKTDYLVVGESPGFKLQKAQQYGVHALDEEAFARFLREQGA